MLSVVPSALFLLPGVCRGGGGGGVSIIYACLSKWSCIYTHEFRRLHMVLFSYVGMGPSSFTISFEYRLQGFGISRRVRRASVGTSFALLVSAD